MNAYQIVFFDMDGTLLDTAPGLLGSLEYTIQKMGLPQISIEEERGLLGAPIRKSARRLFQLSERDSEGFVSIFRHEYWQNQICSAELYPGMLDVLHALRASGIKTAVATNKPQDQADFLVQHFKLGSLFDAVLGCDETGTMRKGELIKHGLALLVPGGLGALVGDTTSDSVGAREGGVDWIAALYGYGPRDREEIRALEAAFSVTRPIEILDCIVLKADCLWKDEREEL